jgi:Ca-activated chloride channel homolog
VLFIALLLLLYDSATAQNNYLKGEVRDEQGNALQNAALVQLSTGYRFYSGYDGTFGIGLHDLKDSLVVSLDGFEKVRLQADAASYLKVILRKAARVNQAQLASQTKDLSFGQQQQWFVGDETYASTVENGFIPAAQFPSTGITLNVDRASYSNIRRFLNSKTLVPPEAVRIEELLNYFNFDYK